MVSSPYRSPARERPEPSGPELTRSIELVVIAWFAWGVTVLRVLAGIARAETPNRELVFAWLILLLVPVVLWKEFRGARPGG